MAVATCSEKHEVVSRKRFSNKLTRIVIAHDASEAAEKALNDGVMLSRQFHAELLLARIHSPQEYLGENLKSVRIEDDEAKRDAASIVEKLKEDGVRSRAITRMGAVGDMLFNLCCEEGADLLLIGAYGHGSTNRNKLGSTAEQLLRALPCPVLTYGPLATSSFASTKHHGPALTPVSLPIKLEQLDEGISLAQLFDTPIEIFHAAPRNNSHDVHWYNAQAQSVAEYIRSRGVCTQWSYMYGEPSRTIIAKASSIDSPFILMPLRWRKGLSSEASDNIAAKVIRLSTVPVLSYRCD